MRMLAVPTAVLLACCVYLPLPRARDALSSLLCALYVRVRRAYTRKDGRTDDTPALLTFALVLGGVLTALSALHPLLSAALMAPAFTGLGALPAAARVKDELVGGAYRGDIPAYEARVRETCASLAPAFAYGVAAPLILCALGTPLHVGAALGALYTAVRALRDGLPAAQRAALAAERIAARVFGAFVLLCAGVVGRHPLRAGGDGMRLNAVLGIDGGARDTHAPVAGDIAQAIFLCAFACALLCFTLTAVGFVFCR